MAYITILLSKILTKKEEVSHTIHGMAHHEMQTGFIAKTNHSNIVFVVFHHDE